MIDCKIRVNSPEESKMIQEYLFSKGVKWNSCGDSYKVQLTEEQILYIRGNMLFFGTSQETFTEDLRPELKFKFGVISYEIVDEVRKMSIEDIEQELGYRIELVPSKEKDGSIMWGYV